MQCMLVDRKLHHWLGSSQACRLRAQSQYCCTEVMPLAFRLYFGGSSLSTSKVHVIVIVATFHEINLIELIDFLF